MSRKVLESQIIQSIEKVVKYNNKDQVKLIENFFSMCKKRKHYLFK